jgi:hypothetical protein
MLKSVRWFLSPVLNRCVQNRSIVSQHAGKIQDVFRVVANCRGARRQLSFLLRGKRKAADITKRDVILLLESVVERGAPATSNQVLKISRKVLSAGYNQ